MHTHQYKKFHFASTQEISFYINFSYYPKIEMLPTWRRESPAMKFFASCLKELHEMEKAHLEEAQARYKESTSVRRKEQPKFQVGDKVWLLQCNIKTSRLCNKLDYHKIGPFRIDK